MMKYNFQCLTLMLCGLFFSRVAISDTVIQDQVVINYSGTIRIPPCTVQNPSVSVNLGILAVESLANTDSSTPWTNFSVGLIHCDAGLRTVQMTLNDTAANTTPGYFTNTGTATNLLVEIASADDSTTISNNVMKAYNLNGAASFNIVLKTRLKNSGHGPATPGTVGSMVTMSLEYK